MIEKHLDLLGRRVTDQVTGFEGVATLVGFSVHGCIMVMVSPSLEETGSHADSKWLDLSRLEAAAGDPVRDQPIFERPANAGNGRKGPPVQPVSNGGW